MEVCETEGENAIELFWEQCEGEGYGYMEYITKEIPEFIKNHFRVSRDRNDWEA